jgi:hypothetical protein
VLPVLTIHCDEQQGRLGAMVAETEMLPALDAIAHALGAGSQVTANR